VHNWDANPGNEDDSLAVLYLGGYGTINLPGYAKYGDDLSRVCYTRTYLPFDLPDNVGWAAAGIGTGALTGGALNIATAANARSYSISPTSTIAQGLILRVAMQQVSGGSLTTDDIAVRVRIDDGANGYDVSWRFTATAFRAYDNTAGAQIGGDVTVEDQADHKAWTAGPTSTGLTDSGGAAGTNSVAFGNIAAATAESDWWELHYVRAQYTGLQMADGFSYPDDLHPRNYSLTPYYIIDGVRAWAVDGPTIIGDEWDIETEYDYPLTATQPWTSISPRRPWRSTAGSPPAVQRAAWQIDDSLAEDCLLGNGVVALGLFGINWRLGTFQGYDQSGPARRTMAAVDAATGMTGLHWRRRGNTVMADTTAGTYTPYLMRHEMAGGTFQFDNGDVRKIVWNTEGRFGPGPSKQCTLYLDGIDKGEGSTGTSGAIWAPNVLVLVKVDLTTQMYYSAYELTVNSQTTADLVGSDSYLETGTIVMGPMMVFGRRYSWGRRLTDEDGTELTVMRDGTTAAREVAPTGRVLEIGWTTPQPLRDVLEDDEPDYLLGSAGGSAEAVASHSGTPYDLAGLFRHIAGSKHGVVYVEGAAKSGTQTLNRLRQFMLARITADIRREGVAGNEESNESVRVPSIVLTEMK